MKKNAVFSLFTFAFLIPLTLYLGTRVTGRWYYLTGTCMIMEAMLPFFAAFEGRKPRARELAVLAVMAALAVAGRVAIPIPHFKASTGIIMITGIAFGPQAGFLTGAVAAFASNFFYSQGPWTPWQMMSYGMAGFLAGLVFRGRKPRALWLGIFGFVSVVTVVGPILDCSTVFTAATALTWRFALAVLLAGLPFNAIHGLSCAATLILLGRPLLRKLQRLQTRYGMLETE